MRFRGLALLIMSFFMTFSSASAVQQDFTAKPVHAIAMHSSPKYDKDFTNFDYVNPNAPKGGELKYYAFGTYDSFNPYILKGMPAAGSSTPFDTLMVSSADEPFTRYGLIAETIEVPADRSFVAFNINPKARFHNGLPVTAEDVRFSFNILRDKGTPMYRYYYANVKEVKVTSSDRILFIFDKDKDNRELPLILSELPVFSAEFFKNKDFSATTLTPILGSGPYRISSFEAGRNITYERVPDYWAADLPVNRGLYNFDKIKYDYYRDTAVALEAFKAAAFDLRIENEAKKWAKGYDLNQANQHKLKMVEFRHHNPSGMQSFVFNTRSKLFKDIKVRQALTYAFDFEWSNKNLFYGFYHRTKSYFDNSVLASSGLPHGRELDLLNKWKGQIPDAIFTTEFTLPVTEGNGQIRENIISAFKLLNEAGWFYKDGKLRDRDGNPFTFEIMLDTASAAAWERITLPFVRNLAKLGITAKIRVVDLSSYQSLLNSFDFDMVVNLWAQSLSPGNEQRHFWGSKAADEKGSYNLAGIKDKAIDDMIEKVISAKTEAELIAATRALDRLLLFGYYVIPQWHSKETRVAYWDKFGMPDIVPLHGVQLMSWWVKDK